MSLINVRNLYAPLRSKLQIGGLIIVTLLVLVIRVSTNSNSSYVSGSGSAGDGGDEGDAPKKSLAELLDEPASPRNSGGTGESDSLVDELVTGKFDRQRKQRQEQQEKSESFDEIRRSLGLE